jgi:hypothetical protein
MHSGLGWILSHHLAKPPAVQLQHFASEHTTFGMVLSWPPFPNVITCTLHASDPPPLSPGADVDLHFWDATDDLLGCQMDLLFERDRVYLHKANGHFGAVPLSVSGALQAWLRKHGRGPVQLLQA